MPLIAGTEVPDNVPSLDKIKTMKIDYEETADKLEEIQPWLKEWTEN